MDADPTYLEPQHYGVVWPLLGGLLLLALVLWPFIVWLMTRPPEAEGSAPLPPAAMTKLRADTLVRIDRIEREVQEDRMTPRRGHHELSTVVRGFVGRVSGLRADTMTATDLRAKGPAHLAALIEEFYPRQFGVDETDRPSTTRSAQAARQVVGGWDPWG